MKKLIVMILAAVLLCGCGQTQQPQTTAPPVVTPTTPPTTEPTTEPTTAPTTAPAETEPEESLQIGYYVLEKLTMDGMTLTGAAVESIKSYIQIRDGGEGSFCMAGVMEEITWNADTFSLGGIPEEYGLIDGVLILSDGSGTGMYFAYCGDTLPEGFETAIPAGYYAVSSIGKSGDVRFFYDVNPDNGWLEMYEDGTGVLCLEGEEIAFTVSGTMLTGENLSMPFSYMAPGEGEALLMLYPYNEYADSIALRPVLKPEA